MVEVASQYRAMSDSQTKKGKMHLLTFPCLAQGHIIPFVELSKLLAERGGFTVTIVNTPLNIRCLQPKIDSIRRAHPGLDLRLAELPFDGTSYGLPPNTETTESLPRSLILPLLKASHQQLEQPFQRLLENIAREEGRPPVCIISDMFLGWTLDVANRLGIPRLTFSTCGAYGLSLFYSAWIHLPHRHTDSETFSLPGFEPPVRLQRSQLPWSMKEADGSDPWSMTMNYQISRNLNSWGTIINTFEKFEDRFLDHIRRTTGRPVWSVGPVLPLTANEPAKSSVNQDIALRGKEAAVDAEMCIRWLDSHRVSSVLYISFGSQNSVCVTQMRELAMGVEASGPAFIWALRPPVGAQDSSGSAAADVESGSEYLPNGFEERMAASKKGLFIRGWAPQLLILSHPSIGGFLSHCGWNSILESISHGVPIIGWPLSGEQFFNSKLLEEEVGVGVEMCRGIDGDIGKEKVERTVRMLFGGEDEMGIRLRKRAMELREEARRAISSGEDGTGSSIANLDDFINKLSDSL